MVTKKLSTKEYIKNNFPWKNRESTKHNPDITNYLKKSVKLNSPNVLTDLLKVSTTFDQTILQDVKGNILIIDYVTLIDENIIFDRLNFLEWGLLTDNGILYFYRSSNEDLNKFSLIKHINIYNTSFYCATNIFKIKTKPSETLFVTKSDTPTWIKMLSKFSRYMQPNENVDKSPSLTTKIRRKFSGSFKLKQMKNIVNNLEVPSAISNLTPCPIGCHILLRNASTSQQIINPAQYISQISENFYFQSKLLCNYSNNTSAQSRSSNIFVLRPASISRDQLTLFDNIDLKNILIQINLNVANLERVEESDRTFRVKDFNGTSFVEIKMLSKQLYESWILLFMKIFVYHLQNQQITGTRLERNDLQSSIINRRTLKTRSVSCPKLNIQKLFEVYERPQIESLYEEPEESFDNGMHSLMCSTTFDNQSNYSMSNANLHSLTNNNDKCCDYEERFKYLESINDGLILPIRCTHHRKLYRLKSSCQNLKYAISRRSSDLSWISNLITNSRQNSKILNVARSSSSSQNLVMNSMSNLHICLEENEFQNNNNNQKFSSIPITHQASNLTSISQNDYHDDHIDDEEIYLEPFAQYI